MTESKAEARAFLKARQSAYRATFSPDLPPAQIVLADLAKYCRAHETTFHTDDRIHAFQEGRRDVFLRIAFHLELSEEQLFLLYS